MRSKPRGSLDQGDVKRTTDLESNFYKNTGLERPEGWISDNNLYYSLNLEGRSASENDIKNAYFKMAKIWHPDKHKNNSEDTDIARDQFQMINFAYTILMNPTKRKIYDLYGLKGIENMQALLKYSQPRNTDDPTPIELLVGGQCFKSKMEDRELLLQHKFHTSKVRIKYDALDVFRCYESDKEDVKNQIFILKKHTQHTQHSFDRVFNNIKPYAVELDTEVSFPGFLSIENANCRNHASIELNTDVVETLIGSDFTYETADGVHRMEMQNYWKIDTVGYLTSDSDPTPSEVTSCFLYELRYNHYLIRNFFSCIFNFTNDKRKPIRILPGNNKLTVSVPFLRNDIYHYFSSLRFEFKINLFNWARSSIKVSFENVLTDDKFILPGEMVQIVVSPSVNLSLNSWKGLETSESGTRIPLYKSVSCQINQSNKNFISIDLDGFDSNSGKIETTWNQKVTNFTTLKTGFTIDKNMVSLDLGFKKAGFDLKFPIIVSDDSDIRYAILLAVGIGAGVALSKKLYSDFLKHKKKALIDKFKFDSENDSIKSKIFQFFGKSERQTQIELLERKRIRFEQISAAERKTEGILKLLMVTFRNRVEEAKSLDGLLIEEAYYGDFIDFVSTSTSTNTNTSSSTKSSNTNTSKNSANLNDTQEDTVFNVFKKDQNTKKFARTYNQDNLNNNYKNRKNYINVTVQLQCMVHENKLQIPRDSFLKDRIVDGFYNPSMDVSESPAPLKIKIKYRFRGERYRCEYNDGDKINLPKKADAVL